MKLYYDWIMKQVVDDSIKTFDFVTTNVCNTINKKYDVGIVLPVFSRAKLLEICLSHLHTTEIAKGQNLLYVIMNDDPSDSSDVKDVMCRFFTTHDCIKITKNRNCGIAHTVKMGFNILTQYEVRNYCLLDTDMLVNSNWLTCLQKCARDVNNTKAIITGFNESLQGHHKIIEVFHDYGIKKSVGGANMYFSSELWNDGMAKVILDENWDWNVVDFCNNSNITLYCTLPSCMQHLGASGMNSKPGKSVDYALDFIYDKNELNCDNDGEYFFFPGLQSKSYPTAFPLCKRDLFVLEFPLHNGLIVNRKHWKEYIQPDISQSAK